MKPITIIGGGLAGLTLGILLRRHQCPVTIHEAGSYPRHRVCGEFISGPGVHVLSQMGLMPGLWERGARWAETALFCSTQARTPRLILPSPALTISRYQLDAYLADVFCREGGILLQKSRWHRQNTAPGLVQSTGHQLNRGSGKWQWIGLKMHASGVAMEADLEMHLVRGTYVGICRIGLDKVNVCALIKRHQGVALSRELLPSLLCGPEQSCLNERLRHADWQQETLCVTAGLDLRPYRAAPDGVCRLGDALTMIAPLTGKGMSMAMEAAAIACPYLVAYGKGESPWKNTQHDLADSLNLRFSRRLTYGHWLNRMAFIPPFPGMLVRLMQRSDRLWRYLFNAVSDLESPKMA